MAKVLGFLLPKCRDLDRVPGSWVWPGPDLPAEVIQGENQWMEKLSPLVFLCLFVMLSSNNNQSTG